jgi:hypothetical protein
MAQTFNTETPKAWRDGLITAAQLQTKQFKPVRIILPDLIPEGVTLLAGKPKVGKSWLAYDVCLAAADETRFVLGDKKPVHGDVLYLPLEDNQRRLKKRLDKILQGASAPARLHLHTEWKRMDQGGLEDIEEWITSVDNPRLIWIDTLAKLRALPRPGEPPYAADYRAIESVQKLAGKYGVGVVFNTHLRKMASEDDAFDEVSGTLGLTGAADTIIVMKRHSGMVKIHVRGRDIEEAEFAAEFNRTTCRWRIVGGADEVFRSQERQAIITALRDAKDKDGNRAPLSVSEVMAATERTDRHPVDQMLSKMRKAGEVVIAGRGLYTIPSPDPLKAGEIDEKLAAVDADAAEVIDNAEVSASDESHRESHRDLTGTESGEIAGEIAKPSKPLMNNGKSNGSHHLTDLTGIEHGEPPDPRDCGPMPESLIRRVPADRRPALGPEGDSLDDLV